MKIVIREAIEKDKNIVLSTWLKGQYWGSDYWKVMDQDEYFKDYGKYVSQLICRPGTKIDCAVIADAPDVVIGYIVYNDQHIYWGYVKKDYRKHGILNMLIKDMDFTTFTARTKIGDIVARKKMLTFNPIILE